MEARPALPIILAGRFWVWLISVVYATLYLSRTVEIQRDVWVDSSSSRYWTSNIGQLKYVNILEIHSQQFPSWRWSRAYNGFLTYTFRFKNGCLHIVMYLLHLSKRRKSTSCILKPFKLGQSWLLDRHQNADDVPIPLDRSLLTHHSQLIAVGGASMNSIHPFSSLKTQIGTSLLTLFLILTFLNISRPPLLIFSLP